MDSNIATIRYFILTAALVVSSSHGHSSYNCTADYQAAARLLVTLKTACSEAVLYDCCQIFEIASQIGSSSQTGVYDVSNVCEIELQPFESNVPTMHARCDMDSEDGGWLVILRRKADVSQQVNFNRSWTDYEDGFGNLETEFWYGLRNIHCLTTRDEVDLRIELKQNDGSGLTWNYGHFKVDGPETNYVLHIGEGVGPGRDAMARHNGHPFSTYDRDNEASSSNCQVLFGGGWWFNNCFLAQLTGPHTRLDSTSASAQLLWNDKRETYFPNVEMKVRPKKCNC